MSGKAKKAGRVSPLRAAAASTKNGAHGVTRPTNELHEDAIPYRASPFRFIDLFCGIGGFASRLNAPGVNVFSRQIGTKRRNSEFVK